MKFKYIGESDSFCIELLAYKLMPKDKYLQKGDIIEVPDDNDIVINALDASGLYVRVAEKKTTAKKEKK
jgi:urease accessory protein UreE